MLDKSVEQNLLVVSPMPSTFVRMALYVAVRLYYSIWFVLVPFASYSFFREVLTGRSLVDDKISISMQVVFYSICGLLSGYMIGRYMKKWQGHVSLLTCATGVVISLGLVRYVLVPALLTLTLSTVVISLALIVSLVSMYVVFSELMISLLDTTEIIHFGSYYVIIVSIWLLNLLGGSLIYTFGVYNQWFGA
jgi:hypothetical protein